jgi:hypothetical protein
MYKKINSRLISILLPLMLFSAFLLSSCGVTDVINQIISNEVSAKDRLDSANAQATRTYGANAKLVMIFGKNVKSNGKTDMTIISAITSLDSIGSWLYVYRTGPSANSFKVYTPNPLPGSNSNIELTSIIDFNTIVNLVSDTSARNTISSALSAIASLNIGITTPTSSLVNSDVSLGFANSTNPVIKFNNNYSPSPSSLNGNVFFSTGTNQTTNMFLIPAAGALNIPQYISDLTGFPADLWIVNYKKTNSSNLTENLILGTVVQNSQVMGISHLTLTSKAINISKYVSQ